jgi:hypothetical protein
MKESSYTRVKCEDLKIACKRYLSARQTRINKEIDELVSKEMNRRFFKPKTREEAISRLGEAISDLHWCGGYWAGRVKDLLELAELSADGFVRLSTNDASIVAPHWP